jgi:ATP-dependent RNA helicase DDX24/MAK5
MLDKLKARVQLARKIENTQHKIKKTNHDRKWMKETADTLGVDLDSDFIRYLPVYIFFLYLDIHFDYSDSDDEEKISNQKRKAKDGAMVRMKAELKHLLSQPLIARGISTRYITSGSRRIVDDLLAGNREYS